MLFDSPYPRVEYVLLAKQSGADFLNYALYDEVMFSKALRRVETFLRSDITLAFFSLRRARGYKTVLAMSERVGLQLALFKRLGLLKSKLVLRFAAWSHRQEKLLRNLDLLPYIDHIIVESKPLGDLLTSSFGVPAERVTFVPYAIDVEYFSEDRVSLPMHAAAQKSTPKIFSAGEIRGRDYATLLDSVSSMPQVEVEIAASGTWFAREKDDTFKAAELPPNVTIAGRMPHSEMREKYAEATCVVIPVLDQVFSAGVTVALEAMAMGKPIVATHSQGLAGYLQNGRNCILVPPQDPEKMKTAIEYLLNNPKCAQTLGYNARRTAEKEFSLETHVAGFRSVLDSVSPLITG